jgi:hypothetical protein
MNCPDHALYGTLDAMSVNTTTSADNLLEFQEGGGTSMPFPSIGG